MSDTVALQAVDWVDVTIIVDNAIDILAASTEVAQWSPLSWDWSERDQLRSEHGYSAILTVHHEGRTETLLYDAGLGRDTAVHNMDVLGVNPRDFRAMILSHGHVDHHGGLEGLVRRIGRRYTCYLPSSPMPTSRPTWARGCISPQRRGNRCLRFEDTGIRVRSWPWFLGGSKPNQLTADPYSLPQRAR